MSDRDALLAAICARPAEDVPRLAFADWLDEYGSDAEREWAAFIREDVAHAARDDYDPVLVRWQLIEKLKRESEPWARDLFAEYRADPFEPVFARGFPWFVPTTPDELTAREPDLASGVPAPVFALTEPSLALGGAFGSPHLARASGVRLRNTELTPHQALALGNAPHAAALTEVDAADAGIAPQAAPVLVRADLFPRLKRLALSGGGWGGSGTARALAEAPASAVEALWLRDSPIEAGALAALLASPVGTGLERLHLDGHLDRAGAAELAGAGPRLAELAVPGAGIGRGGFVGLVASPLIGRLRALDASANGLDALSADALAEHPGAAALRVLALGDNALRSAGAEALFRSPHLAALLLLDLSRSDVGDAACAALLDSPLCASLVLLDLTGNPIGARARAALAARMGDRVTFDSGA